MWGLIAGMFGGSSKAEKGVSFAETALAGVGNWIDEKDFTPEEKSKALAEASKRHLEHVSLIANENSGRSVTRRWLAWGIASFILFWASVAMCFAIAGEKEIVESIIYVAEKLYLGWAFCAVVVLYFGVQFKRK